jgi:small-conductance mechanosensitive channel
MAIKEWLPTDEDQALGNGAEADKGHFAHNVWLLERRRTLDPWTISPPGLSEIPARLRPEDEFYRLVMAYLANSAHSESDLRSLIASDAVRRGERAAQAPRVAVVGMSRFFHWGMMVVTFLLALSAAALAIAPVAGVAGAGIVLAAWGFVVIVDTAKHGQSLQDPRFGVLVLIAGISTLSVLVIRALTG